MEREEQVFHESHKDLFYLFYVLAGKHSRARTSTYHSLGVLVAP